MSTRALARFVACFSVLGTPSTRLRESSQNLPAIEQDARARRDLSEKGRGAPPVEFGRRPRQSVVQIGLHAPRRRAIKRAHRLARPVRHVDARPDHAGLPGLALGQLPRGVVHVQAPHEGQDRDQYKTHRGATVRLLLQISDQAILGVAPSPQFLVEMLVRLAEGPI